MVLKEYTLTLDMAKELSIVERNEGSKEARWYFIECDRLAKQAMKANQGVSVFRAWVSFELRAYKKAPQF